MIATAFEPGRRVSFTDHRSVRVSGRLVERHRGQIAGRPYWTIRLDGGPITSMFEDSLTREDDR
jgi:hypothetical protein